MKNSDLNNEYLDDEIDLRELLRTIFNSKKLIILITLASALLTFIYVAQNELAYKSTVILEVGSHPLLSELDENELLTQTVDSLIKKLMVDLNYKNNKEFVFKPVEEGQLLEINFLSSSPESSENELNKAIKYVEESHMNVLNAIVSSFYEKIIALDRAIEYEQKSQKLIDINLIKDIDSEITADESKIKLLIEIITEEENNLLLLKSNPSDLLQRTASSSSLQQTIYDYKEQIISFKNNIQKLQQVKDTLELQIKSIAEGESTSETLFNLRQDKVRLELRLKLLNDQTNTTQPVAELVTREIKPKQLLPILIVTILGFMFSVFIVLIREPFLKKRN